MKASWDEMWVDLLQFDHALADRVWDGTLEDPDMPEWYAELRAAILRARGPAEPHEVADEQVVVAAMQRAARGRPVGRLPRRHRVRTMARVAGLKAAAATTSATLVGVAAAPTGVVAVMAPAIDNHVVPMVERSLLPTVEAPLTVEIEDEDDDARRPATAGTPCPGTGCRADDERPAGADPATPPAPPSPAADPTTTTDPAPATTTTTAPEAPTTTVEPAPAASEGAVDPVEPAPAAPPPAEPAPTDPAPTTPTEPAPTTPADPTPVEPTSAPGDDPPAPVDTAPDAVGPPAPPPVEPVGPPADPVPPAEPDADTAGAPAASEGAGTDGGEDGPGDAPSGPVGPGEDEPAG